MKKTNWLIRIFVPVFLLIIFSPPAVQAQDTLFITGTVFKASKPYTHVWVIVFDGRVQKGSSLTGDDGMYFIGKLKQQSYTIVVRRTKRGANLISKEAALPEDEEFDIKIH